MQRLFCFRQAILHIRGIVHPAPLLACLRIHLLQRRPEPHGAIKAQHIPWRMEIQKNGHEKKLRLNNAIQCLYNFSMSLRLLYIDPVLTIPVKIRVKIR